MRNLIRRLPIIFVLIGHWLWITVHAEKFTDLIDTAIEATIQGEK